MQEALHYLEFPNWDVAAVAYLAVYKAIKAQGFTVVLEGHGSDEQLGGYSYMVKTAITELWHRRKYKNALELLRVAENMQNRPRQFMYSLLAFLKHYYVSLSLEDRVDTFQNCLNIAWDFKILPIALRTFDRMSMRSAVESRSPFMDYRVVEFLKKLPFQFKISSLGSKSILREILMKYKKDFIYNNHKKLGFGTDEELFFKSTDTKNFLQKQITNFAMEDFKSLKQDALVALSKQTVPLDQTVLIWKIASLSIINKEYNI